MQTLIRPAVELEKDRITLLSWYCKPTAVLFPEGCDAKWLVMLSSHVSEMGWEMGESYPNHSVTAFSNCKSLRYCLFGGEVREIGAG